MSKKPIEYEAVWYGGSSDNGVRLTAPIETRRVKGTRWPDLDVDGRTMYENTHFSTENAAWERLIVNARASVSLDTGSYRDAQIRVVKATAELAESAARAHEIETAFEERTREVARG